MLVDLVNVTTEDGVRNHGALQRAAGTNDASKADVLLCLHGVGSNFYSGSLFERITPPLLNAGISVLWANTRGRDSAYTAWVGSRAKRLGAAHEIVDECRYDIAAWFAYLKTAGFVRPGLLGHSLGAIKAIYSEAYQPWDATTCVVAMSPPRLSFSAFRNGLQQASFSASIELAEQAVRDNRSQALIEVSVPIPMSITAAGYLDKYGSEEKYNILRFANRVRTSTLFTYGEHELASRNLAFAGVPEALRELPSIGQQFEIRTINGADHNYTEKHAEVTAVVLDWIIDRGESADG